MRFPRSCELDPDSDLTLILLDHGDTEEAIVNRLKKVLGATAQSQGKPVTSQMEGPATKDNRSLASKECQSLADYEANEMRFKTSSKHLDLASPVFKSTSAWCFAEAKDVIAGRPAEVHLPDDDPAALWLLLYIIHGKPKKVPAKVSLETLR